jgi:hypothetical protein
MDSLVASMVRATENHLLTWSRSEGGFDYTRDSEPNIHLRLTSTDDRDELSLYRDDLLLVSRAGSNVTSLTTAVKVRAAEADIIIDELLAELTLLSPG